MNAISLSVDNKNTVRCIMSEVWQTKNGLRRVRHDPPTLEEAIQAARGLTDDLQEQVEIAASLMELPREKVMAAAMRLAQRKDVNRGVAFTARRGAERAVVVERRKPRMVLRRKAGT
jgi:hypothetical protein